MAVHLSWAFAFGLLGNIISFLFGVAPLPTFYKIYKKKSSEGFQSVPYVISLLSAMLWIYYALLKDDVLLLITINTFCCVVQTFYISAHLFYATKKSRILTLKLLLLIVFGFGTICLLTFFLAKGTSRSKIIGYICMAFSLSVFVAPLAIVRKVIRTKSVEFMPFTISFFLTLGAVTWFLYGLLTKDLNIALPNVLGFIFGVIQMVLYMIYRNPKIVQLQEPKLQELSEHIVDVVKLSTIVCSELNSLVPQLDGIENDQVIIIEDQMSKKQSEEEAKQNMDAVSATKV